MLATAMREGGEMVARQAKRYRITVTEADVDNYLNVVRFESILKFVEDK
jgi:HJR/Mrr/RecB family endonuclease